MVVLSPRLIVGEYIMDCEQHLKDRKYIIFSGLKIEV